MGLCSNCYPTYYCSKCSCPCIPVIPIEEATQVKPPLNERNGQDKCETNTANLEESTNQNVKENVLEKHITDSDPFIRPYKTNFLVCHFKPSAGSPSGQEEIGSVTRLENTSIYTANSQTQEQPEAIIPHKNPYEEFYLDLDNLYSKKYNKAPNQNNSYLKEIESHRYACCSCHKKPTHDSMSTEQTSVFKKQIFPIKLSDLTYKHEVPREDLLQIYKQEYHKDGRGSIFSNIDKQIKERDSQINRRRKETENAFDEECEKYLKLWKFTDEPDEKKERKYKKVQKKPSGHFKIDEETQKSQWINIHEKYASNNVKPRKRKGNSSTVRDTKLINTTHSQNDETNLKEKPVKEILERRLGWTESPTNSQELLERKTFPNGIYTKSTDLTKRKPWDNTLGPSSHQVITSTSWSHLRVDNDNSHDSSQSKQQQAQCLQQQAQCQQQQAQFQQQQAQFQQQQAQFQQQQAQYQQQHAQCKYETTPNCPEIDKKFFVSQKENPIFNIHEIDQVTICQPGGKILTFNPGQYIHPHRKHYANYETPMKHFSYNPSENDNSRSMQPGTDNLTYKNPGNDNFTYKNPEQDNFTYKNPGNDNFTYTNPGNDNFTYKNAGTESNTYNVLKNVNSTYQQPQTQTGTENFVYNMEHAIPYQTEYDSQAHRNRAIENLTYKKRKTPKVYTLPLGNIENDNLTKNQSEENLTSKVTTEKVDFEDPVVDPILETLLDSVEVPNSDFLICDEPATDKVEPEV